MQPLKLILTDPYADVYLAFQKHFADLPNVEIKNQHFEAIPEFDCMVSPANSFGLMDGGVDLAITRFFGLALMERVQDRILEEYLGEQPVGTCMIVRTDHPKHPYIAHAPTMRIPKSIANTDQVYVAMWAMLVAVYRHNQTATPPIKSVVCPGLGTGNGRVPALEAARQMALAYSRFLKPPSSISWVYAHLRHEGLLNRN